MSDNQTEKNRYPSRYSPGQWVRADQYIIELVCERRAQALDLGELPVKFWKTPEWEKFFKSQFRKCHTLLKKYDAKAIIGALKQAYKVYSLFAPWLEPLIKKEQEKIAQIPVAPTKVDRVLYNKPKTKKGGNTLLDKLEAIDG